MASIDDVFGSLKNQVVAINSQTSATNTLAGTNNTGEIAASSTTLVKSGAVWVATVSVIVGGSASGYLYNTNSTATLTGNRIYVIPTVVGVYQVQIPCNKGLVVVPGTGQTVSVGYT
jgi:hypothetical protein